MDELTSADLEAVDALVASYAQRGAQPGIAYGVVAGGQLVHAGGLGTARTGGPVPDAGTVFRIASMTKSFTATMVLTLRDEGALGLDDLAEQYVPELKGWPPVTPDAQRVRIRHLLTMTAGLPTDDPWGDREQGTPLPEFAEFLAQGVSFAWAPGTRFEYSNLGYAILGRVISAVTGAPYADVIKARLLDPLGMSQTGYEADRFAPDVLAAGHRREGSGWAELPVAPYGAFAPMGGVFSCVRDLARWVNGFTAAFPPGGQRAGDAHPLAPATRREMQQPAVTLPEAQPRFPGSPAAGSQYGYGFGLFTEETSAWGRLVYHSGGYPGFGSHMRWHPETGLGVVVLANSTYAGASVLAARLMEEVLKAAAAEDGPAAGGAPAGEQVSGSARAVVRGPAPAPGGPWPETLSAQQVVTGLLTHWDDKVAEQLFADNVALDQPLDRRRERIGRMWERLGPPRSRTLATPRPAEFDSPAHCRWWLHGERGDTQVEILLTPENPPRVQSLTVTVPPAADSALWRQTQALIDLLNSSLSDSAPSWPAELPVSGLVDSGLLLRQLRMARAWAGVCRPGAFCGGNGQTSTVVELDGEHAGLTLAVELDGGQRSLRRVDIAPRG